MASSGAVRMGVDYDPVELMYDALVTLTMSEEHARGFRILGWNPARTGAQRRSLSPRTSLDEKFH